MFGVTLPGGYDLAARAARHGGVCGMCGKAFARNAAVYLVRWRVAVETSREGWAWPLIIPLCGGCRPARVFARDKRRGRGFLYHWRYPPRRQGPCEGCGRTVVYPAYQFARRRHFYCCEKCRARGSKRRHGAGPRGSVALAHPPASPRPGAATPGRAVRPAGRGAAGGVTGGLPAVAPGSPPVTRRGLT
jgi:hypothetical protein